MAYEINDDQAKAINHKQIVVKETWVMAWFRQKAPKSSVWLKYFTKGTYCYS